LAGALLERISQAHQAMDSGRPAQAAEAFTELAQEAEAYGQIKRAIPLYRQAVLAYAQAGDGPAALTQARAALQALLNMRAYPWAQKLCIRLAVDLRMEGLADEADAFQREFAPQVGPVHWTTEQAAPYRPQPPGRLPARCPQCGGPLRDDKAEPIDDATVECAYCGSAVRREG
jgi:hypothetical protein